MVRAPLLMLVLVTSSLWAQSPRLERFTVGRLDVTVLHVPDAPRQSTFTVLPTGLVSDRIGEPQFSHLLEHLMIRSTDPVGMGEEDLSFNGETSATGLRLETLAAPARWRESLERHVRWIEADTVDEAVLEREKRNIEGEELSTTASGFTHKWATAAWAQAVRHGASHVLLHGAVAASDRETAIARLRELKSTRARLVTVGPTSRASIAKALGELTAAEVTDAGTGDAIPIPPAAISSNVTLAKNITWDLSTRHFFRWVAIPSPTSVTRGAALVAADGLAGVLLSSSSLNKLGVKAFATANIIVGDHVIFMINAFVPESADASRVEAAIAKLTARSVSMAFSVRRSKSTLLARSAALPDFSKERAKAPKQYREGVDAQLALGITEFETSMGLRFEAIHTALERLEIDAIYAMIDALSGPEAKTLWISPGTPR